MADSAVDQLPLPTSLAEVEAVRFPSMLRKLFFMSPNLLYKSRKLQIRQTDHPVNS
jgi:folate-dependent tRNA-U54 methylase TrmFO/GidA